MMSPLARRWRWFSRAPVLRVIWWLILSIALVVDTISFLLHIFFPRAKADKKNRFTFEALEEKAKLAANTSEEFEDDFHRTAIATCLPSLLQSEMKYFVPAVNFAEFLQRKLVVERTLRENCALRPASSLPKVFIIGLPRTGSTYLHQLCALDPRARTVRAWEFRKPPEFNESSEETGEKIRRVQGLLSLFYRIAPAIKDIHYIEALDADECVQGFMDCAVPDWYLWGAVDAQEAFDWYVREDMTRMYANYAKFLETLPILQHTHMWLKSPHHTFKLLEIARAFPGCKFVWLHREAVENSVASCCSMNQAILDATSPWYLDEQVLGRRTLQRMAQCVAKAMRDRAKLERENQFVDLNYSELKRDPMLAMRSLYAKLGLDFSPEFEARINQSLLDAKRSDTPAHKYALADFGLTRDQVLGEFTDYIRAFQL